MNFDRTDSTEIAYFFICTKQYVKLFSLFLYIQAFEYFLTRLSLGYAHKVWAKTNRINSNNRCSLLHKRWIN